jgi:shikimate kinase
MPTVNGKKFPYTGKGMMDAAAAKKKKINEMGGGETMSNNERNAARDAAMAKRSALKARIDRRTSLDNAADSLMNKAKTIVERRQKLAKNTKKSPADTLRLKDQAAKRISEAQNAYDKKASYVKKMKG